MLTPIERAQAIRLFILDVDGVMTSGTIYYGDHGAELKGFHIADGIGIKLLQKAGIAVAIISGKHSPAVTQRAADLGIKHVYLGHEDKLPAYEQLKQQLKINDEHIAYIGDDLPDLPLLQSAGLAITVPHAPAVIQQQVHLTTTRTAGQGAVREACEFILQAQDKYTAVIATYTKT